MDGFGFAVWVLCVLYMVYEVYSVIFILNKSIKRILVGKITIPIRRVIVFAINSMFDGDALLRFNYIQILFCYVSYRALLCLGLFFYYFAVVIYICDTLLAPDSTGRMLSYVKVLAIVIFLLFTGFCVNSNGFLALVDRYRWNDFIMVIIFFEGLISLIVVVRFLQENNRKQN